MEINNTYPADSKGRNNVPKLKRMIYNSLQRIIFKWRSFAVQALFAYDTATERRLL